jgi:hypothetical protein
VVDFLSTRRKGVMNKEMPPSQAEPQPSVVMDAYWLWAACKTGVYPPDTVRSGKWLIFRSSQEIDEVWAKVKQAVEDGRLGDQAKVATARPNPNGREGRRVICVYTYDSEDCGDVRRIREELRRLGIDEPIPYKTDEDTKAGRYRAKGRASISKFFE